MAKGHLLTSQTDDLVRLFREHGFRKEQFKWLVPMTSSGRSRVEVTYDATSYSFTFKYQRQRTNTYSDPRPGAEQRRHSVEFSPGEGVLDETHHNLDWNRALNAFDKWLRCLRRETDAPDLLAQAEKERGQLLDAREWLNSDESFTSAEQDVLRAELKRLKEELADLRIYTDEELGPIRSRIDELEADLATMQKWKWATLALGLPFRIQGLMDLDADQFRQLWSRLVRLVSDLPQLLPPPGAG